MIPVIFHPAAQAELLDSAKWYNEQEYGLGNDLIDEVSTSVGGLPIFPEMWPDVYNGVRRCPVRRFPYSILYQIFPERIYVFAIMHSSREPGYWLHRLDS